MVCNSFKLVKDSALLALMCFSAFGDEISSVSSCGSPCTDNKELQDFVNVSDIEHVQTSFLYRLLWSQEEHVHMSNFPNPSRPDMPHAALLSQRM